MKRKGQRLRIRPKLVALAVAACFASEPAFANPTGPVVVNGQVTFGAAGSVLTVTNSPNSIINWQRFSIGAGETTRFIQQSAASAVLNRVVGADPSSILGALQSNGRVFLINPNGIIFGPGSQVDVAGLVASTLNLSNEDFLGGRLNFVGDPAKAAAVVNQGRITASEGGRVYLVGSAVDNQGIISAPNGEVVLAAGNSVRVTDSSGSRLQVEITAPADSTVNLSEAVYGSRGIYGGLVRNKGVISANSAVQTADGRIILKASKDVTLEGGSSVTANGAQGGSITAQAETGTLLVEGAVQATGSEGTGGTVQLLGEQVGLVNRAVVDASGAAGGGTVNVGGSRQGEGPLPNSRAVFIGSETRIAANATASGDGGTVIVYADDAARIHGALEAKGGPQGGNGGFVETSGKQFLDVTRLPDVTAGAGAGGEWLIDPFNITITTTANQCANLTGCVNGPDWTSSNNNAQLGVNLINNALDAGTSVTVTTGAAGTQAGNVTFAGSATVNKTAGGDASLTVTAANNIVFNAGANITSTSGQLDVTLNAGAAITNVRAIDTNGGTLTLNNSTTITQAAGGISGSGALVKDGAGTLTLSQNNTYTGATTINAGTVIATNAGGLGDTAGGTTVNTGATLELRGSLVWAEPVTLAGGTLARGTGNPTLTGAVDLAADSVITGAAGTLTLSGDVSGAGTLTKTGSNIMVLSGNNTYSGVTNINAGTLTVASAGALGSAASGTTVNAGATLALNGTLTSAEPVTLAGGTLSRAAGLPTLTGAVDLAADSVITAAAGTLIVSGDISGVGGFSKAGNGMLLLSGNNTYTGATIGNAGTLRVAGGNGIGDTSAVTMAGGTLDINNTTETIGSLDGTRPVTLGAGTLVTGGNDASTTYTGVISGAGGALTKEGAGTFTLAGNNTYTGATNINGGTLAANHNNALGTTAGGTTVASGATLEIAGGIAIGTEALNLSGAGAGGSGAVMVASGSGSFAGAVTLGANTSLGGDGNLMLSGIVNDTAPGTSVLTQVGNGVLTFSNTVGATNALAGMTTSGGQTTALNGGSVRTTGSQAYGGTVTTSGATTLTSTTGGNITANNAANNFTGDLGLTTSGVAGIVNSGSLALGASSISTLTAQALGGDLTLNGAITATGTGDSIVLAAAANFTNNAGAAALDPGVGRWLVYSTDPALDSRGGLAYSFKQYNAPFATAPAGVGNGFLYSVAPVITPSLTGTVTKVYDGTTAATLAAGNYALSGAIDGDTVTLNNPAAGSYDTKNFGTGKQVTASGIAIASATDGGATVYGYQLSSTAASANIGDITQRALTMTAASDTKVYDGTTGSTAAPTITSGSLAVGDTAGFAQTFDTRNVGVGKTLAAAGAVNDGNGGNNYAVTFVTDNTGVITAAPLSITADDASRAQGAGNPPFTATYSGFQGGETPTVLTGVLNFSTPAISSSPAGLYPITPYGQSSANYAITYVDGVLTVTGGFPVLPGTVPVDGATNLIVGGFEQLGIATSGPAASCTTSNQPNGIELMAGASGWAHWTCATGGQ